MIIIWVTVYLSSFKYKTLSEYTHFSDSLYKDLLKLKQTKSQFEITGAKGSHEVYSHSDRFAHIIQGVFSSELFLSLGLVQVSFLVDLIDVHTNQFS